ncbi:MAG TPA: hypothetical protein VGM56_26990 [Byssovorax sp.]|jgi:hypothetical protein
MNVRKPLHLACAAVTFAAVVLLSLGGCEDTGLEKLLGADREVPCASQSPTECDCAPGSPGGFGTCDSATFERSLCCFDQGYAVSGSCTCELWSCAVSSEGCTCQLTGDGVTPADLECFPGANEVCCLSLSHGAPTCTCRTGTDCGSDLRVLSCSLDDTESMAAVCRSRDPSTFPGAATSDATDACSARE